MKPDFFVVGTGRSGTTLVRALLTGHSDIAIPGETGFLPRLIRLTPLWWRSEGFNSHVFVRLAMANGRVEQSGLSKDALMRRLGEESILVPGDAITVLYRALSGTGLLIGDKTPGYVRHVGLLAKYYPNAKFIRLVRHPLDVIASLRQQTWGPSNVKAAAHIWSKDQRLFERAAAGLGERTITVRLEDVVSDAENEVQRMANLLHVQVQERMFGFNERADEIAAQNYYPESHRGLRQGLTNTRSWTTELSAREAGDAWRLVGGQALELGYDDLDLHLERSWLEPVGRLEALARVVWFDATQQWRRLRTVRGFLGR